MANTIKEIIEDLNEMKTTPIGIGLLYGVGIVLTQLFELNELQSSILKASLGVESRSISLIVIMMGIGVSIIIKIFKQDSILPKWLKYISKVGYDLFIQSTTALFILLAYSLMLTIFFKQSEALVYITLVGLFVSLSGIFSILLGLQLATENLRKNFILFCKNPKIQILYIFLTVIFIIINFYF